MTIIESFVVSHRDMALRFLCIDTGLALLMQVFILGNRGSFDFMEYGAFIFTFFIALLSIYISVLKQFGAGPAFYLSLPVNKGLLSAGVLLIQLIPFTVISLAVGTLLGRAFFPMAIPGMYKNAFHVMMFMAIIRLSSLPVLILLNNFIVIRIIKICVFFMSFILVWIVTSIIDETLFTPFALRYAYVFLLFTAQIFCISWIVCARARL